VFFTAKGDKLPFYRLWIDSGHLWWPKQSRTFRSSSMIANGSLGVVAGIGSKTAAASAGVVN